MTAEEFLAVVRRAQSLPGAPGLIDGRLSVLPFRAFELRLPKELWHHRVSPSVWERPRREVPIEELVTAQPHLARAKLLSMVGEPDLARLKHTPMIVIEQGGELVLFDGNHRANALKLHGETHVTAIVMEARRAS